MNITYLYHLVKSQASSASQKSVLRYRNDATTTWIPMTWSSFAQKVDQAARALVLLGVEELDRLATYTQNKYEGLVTDFAAFTNRCSIVPLYATCSTSQVEYILQDSGARLLFVGEQFQYDEAYAAVQNSSTVMRMIIFDSKVIKKEEDTTSLYFEELLAMGAEADTQAQVEERTSHCDREDLACLIYTSGTTGEPKGVMLTHHNFYSIFDSHKNFLPLTDKDVSMCFLPMAHIFERAWSYYCMTMNAELLVNLRPQEVQQSLRETEPTVMCAVPRFWEKVYQAVLDKQERSKGIVKTLMGKALAVGAKYNQEYYMKGKKAPLSLALQYKFYDRLVLSKIRLVAGLKNGHFFPTSGAALSTNIIKFLHAVGINICYGYGLTETCATVSCYRQKDFVYGTLGTFVPGVNVRIGENNEIQVKADTVMKGYYNKPEETKAAFTEDGWFRTGDAGEITPSGEFYMRERIKDLFKTANGKYIAPQALEGRIAENKYIEQVAIVGDQRKFVSALIVPAMDTLKVYAIENGIFYSNSVELIQRPAIVAFLDSQVKLMQSEFASFEQVKRFTLLHEPFTMDKGELTNTLKLKRNVIMRNYAAEIEAMYAY